MVNIAVLGYGTVGSGVVEVINTNHDIYVATHQEGEDKGVYYTDVYLLK